MNLLSITGLIFDIIGVILLSAYGLPSKIEKVEDDHHYIGWTKENKKSKIIAKKHNKKVYLFFYSALILMVFGFLLQLLGQIFFSPIFPSPLH
jgi:hypothetical protein